MYNLIFYFFYYYHDTREGNEPVETGRGAVSMTILMQIFCGASAFTYFTGIHLFGGPSAYPSLFKVFAVIGLILYYFLFRLIYNKKRVNAIIESWPKDKKVLTIKNSILIFLFSIGPVIVGAQFLNAK